MKNLTNLNKAAALVESLTNKLLNFKVEDYLDEDFYEDMMNECDGDVEIQGIVLPAGTTLRKMDYVAFRQSWLNYCNSVDPTEVWYYEDLEEELKEAIEALQKEMEKVYK